ncbi:MAG: acylphosphatase [Granulosicoccaceae bacterium]
MTLLINGHFPNDTFPKWIISRAERLNLSGWVKAHGEHLVEIFVTGDPILIDAMEVACSLGPIDAEVQSIDKQQQETAEQHYRHPARFIRY